MTITHLSHFGLEKIADTDTSVVFSGSLGACKRMAAAHGMEVERYEGAIVSFDECGATYAPSSPEKFAIAYYRGGGLVIKGRDDWSLVMPLEVWTNH